MKTNKEIFFNEIYKDYYNKMYRYIFDRIKNQSNCCTFDTEELTNDVFLKVYKHLDNYNPEIATLNTWIYKITNNTIIDWNRTKMLKQRFSIDTIQDNFSDEIKIDVPDNRVNNDFNSYDNTIIRNEIDQSINKLHGISKDIAKLYFKNEFQYSEIEKELNIPIGTVKGTIHRTKKQLQKDLANIY